MSERRCGFSKRALALTVLLGACSKSMPPGDWTGHCGEGKTSAGAWQKDDKSRLQLVVDEGEILATPFESDLNGMLEAFEAETCHQLMVVTVPSLKGQSIESVSAGLATRIGPGYPRFNNGLILLIARDERKVRIEIGCGLEDVLSSEQTSAIIQQKLIPPIGEGDVNGAIRSAMDAIMERVRSKVIPPEYRPAGCPKKAG
jgi:uncharacterized protein